MTLEFDERQMDESIEILVDIVVKDKMDNLHGKCPYSDPNIRDAFCEHYDYCCNYLK